MKKSIIVGILAIIFCGFLVKNFSFFEKKSPVQNMTKIEIWHHNGEKSYASGYFLKKNILITANHILRSEADIVRVRGMRYFPIFGEKSRDILYLSSQKNQKISPPTFAKILPGEKVYAWVFRDEKWQKIEGIFLTKNPITTFNNYWQIENIMINTYDFASRAGDSGSPIWSQNHEIVDIIHTEK